LIVNNDQGNTREQQVLVFYFISEYFMEKNVYTSILILHTHKSCSLINYWSNEPQSDIFIKLKHNLVGINDQTALNIFQINSK